MASAGGYGGRHVGGVERPSVRVWLVTPHSSVAHPKKYVLTLPGSMSESTGSPCVIALRVEKIDKETRLMRITACGGGGPLGRFHNMLFSLVRGTKPPARSDGPWTELTVVVPTEAEAASIFTGSSIAKTTPHAAATRAEGQPISSGATQDELSEPDSSSLSSSSGKLAIECAKVRADDADKRAALADKRAALADERAALAMRHLRMSAQRCWRQP